MPKRRKSSTRCKTSKKQVKHYHRVPFKPRPSVKATKLRVTERMLDCGLLDAESSRDRESAARSLLLNDSNKKKKAASKLRLTSAEADSVLWGSVTSNASSKSKPKTEDSAKHSSATVAQKEFDDSANENAIKKESFLDENSDSDSESDDSQDSSDEANESEMQSSADESSDFDISEAMDGCVLEFSGKCIGDSVNDSMLRTVISKVLSNNAVAANVSIETCVVRRHMAMLTLCGKNCVKVGTALCKLLNGKRLKSHVLSVKLL